MNLVALTCFFLSLTWKFKKPNCGAGAKQELLFILLYSIEHVFHIFLSLI
jgi:hypothetical protein